MEYGECVVLEGRDRSVLMVDCGSVSQRLREGDVPLESWVDQIADRYQSSMDRHFLLTHFHRDHLSGFQRILENREGYFSRVLLPRSPLDSRGVPLLLEFALFAYLFAQPQSDSFQVNTWCVKAFRALSQRLGQDRIFTLGAGDRFHFDGVEYQVLWPPNRGVSLRGPAFGGAGGTERPVLLPPSSRPAFNNFSGGRRNSSPCTSSAAKPSPCLGRALPGTAPGLSGAFGRGAEGFGSPAGRAEPHPRGSRRPGDPAQPPERRGLHRRGQRGLGGVSQRAEERSQRAGHFDDRGTPPRKPCWKLWTSSTTGITF